MLPPRNFERRNREGNFRIRSPKHRAFVRTHLCVLFERQECQGKVDCAHVRDDSPATMGSKRSDALTVAMCRRHHSLAHSVGEEAINEEYGVNLLALAKEFAAKSPDAAVRMR